MSEKLDNSASHLLTMRKKLLFRARHRGFKEADLIIGSFAEAHIHEMNGDDLLEFENLLDGNDWDIYAYIIGEKHPTPSFDGPVLKALQRFHHSVYKSLI